jgi:diguanylate cyclase (GGDEF)-like protein
MMEAASVSRSAEQAALRACNAELVGQLRAAAMADDDARIARLLSELLRFKGLTKGQRISLQLKALLNLVHSLRCVASTDDLTGLYNRRGFMQIGARLLDVATRDERSAHLIRINAAMGRTAGDVMIRQMGNFMRDLYPSYGVYEVLGRLGDDEFAALTTCPEYASRGPIVARAGTRPPGSCDLPALSLSVGVAHFNPRRPVGIDELLESAEQVMYEHKRVTRIASSELNPPTRYDALLTASRRGRGKELDGG